MSATVRSAEIRARIIELRAELKALEEEHAKLRLAVAKEALRKGTTVWLLSNNGRQPYGTPGKVLRINRKYAVVDFGDNGGRGWLVSPLRLSKTKPADSQIETNRQFTQMARRIF